MTAQNSDAIRETARRWVIACHAVDFADWDGLTLWLESGAAHLDAYETALDDDVWSAEMVGRQPLKSAVPIEPIGLVSRPRRVSRMRGGAIAASVAAVAVAGGWAVFDRSAPREIATVAGEHRNITLADGTRVAMNGATRIRFDPGHPRDVTLAGGEALFVVHHDADHPFLVRAGGARLVDAGTVFNVIADGGALDVAVAEGAVVFGADQRRIRLDAGEALSRASTDAAPVMRKVEPGSVGAWRTGYLQYADASLSRIAADLARTVGKPVRVDNTVAATRFSGTIMLDGPPEQIFSRAGPLLSVRFIPEQSGWRMAPIDGARR